MLKKWFWVLLLVPAFAQWHEVQSPHFKVITNAGVASGRTVARNFEQVHFLFEQLFQGLNNSANKDLVIIALSGKTVNDLMTQAGHPPTRPLPATFISSSFRNYIILAVDELEEAQRSIFHEYTHMIVDSNLALPCWLNEGLANVIMQTEIQDNQIHLGKVERNARILLVQDMVPLQTLVDVDHGSPLYDEANTSGIFYAQAWLLTHYALMSPAGREKKMFQQLILLNHQGATPLAALQQAAGDLTALQEELQTYLENNRFPYITLPASGAVSAEAFAVNPLSHSQITSYMAVLKQGRPDAIIERDTLVDLEAHQSEPGVAINLALIYVQQGQPVEAMRVLQRNKKDLAKDWLFNYLLTYDYKMEPRRQRYFLEKVLEEKPNFAQAAYRLALLLKFKDAKTSLKFARQAVKADPSSSGYRLLLGEMMLKLGNVDQVEALAEQSQVFARAWDELTDAEYGISQYELPRTIVDEPQQIIIAIQPPSLPNLSMPPAYRRDLLYLTPLLKAIWQKRTDQDLAALLTQAPQERSLYGESALHLAAELGRTSVVGKLLAAGCDKNGLDAGKWSPLMLAAAHDNPKLALSLVEAGAKLDSTNEFGQTSLMWACFHGHIELVKRLIAKGAKRDLQDKDGHTAIDYVDHRKNQPLYRLLRDLNIKTSKAGALNARQRKELPQARAQAMQGLYRQQHQGGN